MLPSLLRHLDSARPTARETWRGWQITPVTGGANALVYRVTCQPADYAVKFTARDERDRAGREYAALDALHSGELSAIADLLRRKSLWDPSDVAASRLRYAVAGSFGSLSWRCSAARPGRRLCRLSGNRLAGRHDRRGRGRLNRRAEPIR